MAACSDGLFFCLEKSKGAEIMHPLAYNQYQPNNMNDKEKEIANFFLEFEKKYQGKAARQVEAYLVRDIIDIRSTGSLSPAEEELAKNEEGRLLLKQLKAREMESTKNILKFQLENLMDTQIISLTIDTIPELDENIVVTRLADSRKVKQGVEQD